MHAISSDTRLEGWLELGKICLTAFTGNGEGSNKKRPTTCFFADGDGCAVLCKAHCLVRAFNVGGALCIEIDSREGSVQGIDPRIELNAQPCARLEEKCRTLKDRSDRSIEFIGSFASEVTLCRDSWEYEAFTLPETAGQHGCFFVLWRRSCLVCSLKPLQLTLASVQAVW